MRDIFVEVIRELEADKELTVEDRERLANRLRNYKQEVLGTFTSLEISLREHKMRLMDLERRVR